VLLEASSGICQDPRAIALSGDTIRILEILGITQTDMHWIGQRKKVEVSHRINGKQVSFTGG
jgi:2-polyprenyl-6-methoxyphenol hydroxylase-like FAD-dependent oxidoreductase